MSTMSDMLSELWAKSREQVMARVAVIESAAVALHAGTFDAEQRAAAERDAHKLAGVAGTFGYWDATDLAREAENLFSGADAISEDGARRIETIGALLRAQLS
jgi:HPt (histidine-containing phosphotransfer) domain-containing protein